MNVLNLATGLRLALLDQRRIPDRTGLKILRTDTGVTL